MAATIGNPLAVVFSPFNCRQLHPSIGMARPHKRISSWRSALSTSSEKNSAGVQTSSRKREGGVEKNLELPVALNRLSPALDEEDPGVTENLTTYFEQAMFLANSTCDGGGPRWFCPLECGRPRLRSAPLLLYLPGSFQHPLFTHLITLFCCFVILLLVWWWLYLFIFFFLLGPARVFFWEEGCFWPVR